MSLRWGWPALLLAACMPAWADGCVEALDRFDYRQAEAIAQARLVKQATDADALLCLARSQYERGDFSRAMATLAMTDRLALAPLQQARINNWYAVTLRKFGQLDRAWQRQQAALALAGQLGDAGTLATALHNTATLLNDYGQKSAALSHYRQSAAFNPDLAERSASFNNMALIEDELGHPAAAEQFFLAAIALNRQHGHFHHLGKHLMNLGNHYRQRQRFDEAAPLIREGLGWVGQAGDRYWIAVGHRLMAWLTIAQGKRQEAAEQLRQAIAGYEASGAAPDAKAARGELAALGN